MVLNSIWLMLSTAIMAGFGLIYWVLSARVFLPYEVGLATTLVSATTMISIMATYGLRMAATRFIKNHQTKNEFSNTLISISLILALILSAIYWVTLPYHGGELKTIWFHGLIWLMFVILTLGMALSNILEGLFLGYKQTKYILYKNALMAGIKAPLPFLVLGLGVLGLMISWTLAYLTATLIGLYFLIKHYGFKVTFKLDKNILFKIAKFSLGAHASSILANAPPLLLPILITAWLNPKETAYFYMAMMMANMMYIIPLSTSQSAFAEGAHVGEAFNQALKHGMKMALLLMLPAILAGILLGKWILGIFGADYSTYGYGLLTLLLTSGLFMIPFYFGQALLSLEHRFRELLKINLGLNLGLVGLTYLLKGNDLWGVGVAWIVSFGITGCWFMYLLVKNLSR